MWKGSLPAFSATVHERTNAGQRTHCRRGTSPMRDVAAAATSAAPHFAVVPQALMHDDNMDEDAINSRIVEMFAAVVLQLACLHATGIVHVSGAVAAHATPERPPPRLMHGRHLGTQTPAPFSPPYMCSATSSRSTSWSGRMAP